MRVLPVALVVCISALPLAAQELSGVEPELITDRPDFTESPVVVPLGRVQLEGGITYLHEDGSNNFFSGPELLVRWTVAPRFELRFGLPDYVRPSASGLDSGWTDSSLGFKVQIGPMGSWDVAAIAQVSLPTGNTGYTGDAYDPGVVFIVGRELGDRASFGTQLSVDWLTVDDERELLWGATAVVGYAISDEWGTFGELAIEVPEEGSAPLLFHSGVTRALGSNSQLDVHAAAGLNDAAPDWLLGAGFAVRF
jgi:hypothetical protein